MSLIYTNSILSAGYGKEDLFKEVFPVWQKGTLNFDYVQHPPQENLAGETGAFPYI